MSEKPQVHRPGLFKLPNKSHKNGPHRSKAAISRDSKGKLGVKATSFKKNRNLSKAERKNRVQQLRGHKNELLMAKDRMEGGPNRAPYLTTVISFDGSITSQDIIDKVLTADPEAVVAQNQWSGSVNLSVKRFKSRYTFVSPNQESMNAVLDCVKVSDVLAIVWPPNEAISEYQELLMTSILAQGLPTVIHAVCGLPPNGKQRDQMRKILEKSMERWGMSSEKLHALDSDGDALQILRLISSIKKNSTILQQRRSHLLVDSLSFVKEEQDGNCTLKVTGFVRGPPFSVNKMVHIQGWGDFRLSKIDVAEDPRQKPRIVTRDIAVSDNQSSMIIDAEVDSSDEDDEETMDGLSLYDAKEEDDPDFDDADKMSVSMAGDNCSSDFTGDSKINMEEVEKYRQERENAKWPDEIDTPHETPARERFQKYRGLKSFRRSPWDPKENLPKDYGKIYKFSNFKQSKKIVLSDVKKSYLHASDAISEFVLPGSSVTLHIAEVPSDLQDALPSDAPLVIFGLLTHEEKMSVMNMVLQMHPSCKVPIKNKQKLIFQVGYRKFESEALLSEHTNGTKFKMHRFMPTEGTFCASVFAPVMFPPSTVLVFRRDRKGRQHLVATGIVLDLNPDRIVLKRVVLSGHPYRINKRVAVVRYMFFNKEDVEWFKPVEVYTQRGRRGHIKESLGTHGLLKCLFDQALTSQESVMLNLYKRVFPKWKYNARVEPVRNSVSVAFDESDAKMEED